VLAEIGAGDIPQLLVFNKIDRLDGVQPHHDAPANPQAAPQARERIWLSAGTGAGLDLLRASLAHRFGDRQVRGELRLAPADGRFRARLHGLGVVRREQSDEHGWRLEVELPLGLAERLADEAGGHLLQPLLLVGPGAPTYNPDTH
jgi:GTP-binding protein HflX